MKKYLVIAGGILSKNDETVHRISCMQLCKLYKVNPQECDFADKDRPETIRGRDFSQYEAVLLPRYDGNYSIELARKEAK